MSRMKMNKTPLAGAKKKKDGQNAENSQEDCATTVVQVSFLRNPYFYAKFGQKLLVGSKNEPGKNQIIISGLGTAAKNAIASATIMDKENCGKIAVI